MYVSVVLSKDTVFDCYTYYIIKDTHSKLNIFVQHAEEYFIFCKCDILLKHLICEIVHYQGYLIVTLSREGETLGSSRTL